VEHARQSAKGAARTAIRLGNRFAPHSVLREFLGSLAADTVVSSSATEDGMLATIEGVPGSSQLQLTAVNTLEGPMAFALYKAPIDFDRSGRDDNSASRTISFKVTSVLGPPNLTTAPVTIWRGPIVLVHGYHRPGRARRHEDAR